VSLLHDLKPRLIFLAAQPIISIGTTNLSNTIRVETEKVDQEIKPLGPETEDF
jgi:hypothetical protein